MRRALTLTCLVTVFASPVAAIDAPTPRPPPQRPAPSPGPCTMRTGETLVGTYLCAQGITDVTLHVLAVRGPSLRVEFVFSHAPSRAAGRFTLTGTCNAGHVALTPEAWIERPAGYIMVGMDGTSTRGRFDGRMTHPSCGAFNLAAR